MPELVKVIIRRGTRCQFRKMLILAFLLFNILSAYTIHIKSPYTANTLYIYGSNEFGWESSPTNMTSEGDGWFSVNTSSNSSTQSLTLSDAVSWPKSTVSLGSVSSLFSGDNSATDVWVTMSTTGVVSKVYTDPNGSIDTTINGTDSTIRVISAIVRDQPADGVEFQSGSGGLTLGMVQDTLSSDGSILKGANEYHSAGLEGWFKDKNDNDTCIYMEWKRDANGYWEYDSDDYGGFFPIDNFNHPNNSKAQLGHNYHFTMEIHTQFEYKEGESQVFEFRGDDDVWVFVNRKLAIDIGGVHGAISGSVNLDSSKVDLGLVDGENYALDIFFCERQTSGSNFRAKTTIDISNGADLFYDSSSVLSKIDKYDIKQFDLVESDLCGFNVNNPDADTTAAHVDFLLGGVQFGTGKKVLLDGKHYGGIEILGDSSFTLTLSEIYGLATGDYTLSFVSKDNDSLSGEVNFSVVRNIIIPDTIYLNSGNDTIVKAHGVSITAWSGDSSFTLITDSLISISPTGNSWYKVISYSEVSVENINADFEDPVLSNDFAQLDQAAVPGWKTTSSDGLIEVWTNGMGVPAYSGNQFVELNATEVADLYQDISTVPGTVVSISFAHRGRQGIDKMGLKAGPPGGPYELLGTYSDSTDKWGFYREAYAVPDGQTETRIFFTSEAYSGSSVGNFLDAISYTKVIETDRDSVIVIVKDSVIHQLSIKSSLQSGSSFRMDTTVYLHGEVDGEKESGVKIYYLVDYGDTLDIPDSTSGTLYDSSKGITIDATAKIHAVAYKKGYIYDENSWTYILDLIDITIDVTPSDPVVYYFGESIEKITINTSDTSDITVTWIVDTLKHTEIEDFTDYGIIYDESLNYPWIQASSRDTVYLSVMAIGIGYDTTYETFKYVRLYLPEITADPASGTVFSGELSVALNVDDPDNLFENIQIYYVLVTDSSEGVDSSDNKFNNNVFTDVTTYIKAVAYADNAVTSPIFTGCYILATGSGGSWYKDLNGNGKIDAVSIKLTKEPHLDSDMKPVYPDSIQFVNPFDSTDIQTIMKSEMLIEGTDLFVTLLEEFYDVATLSTAIDSGEYGKIFGHYYVAEGFSIMDSVAPVIKRAVYQPGDIKKEGGEVIQDEDRLHVIFTEAVSKNSVNNGKQLFDLLDLHRSPEYSFGLTMESHNGVAVTFIVDSINGKNYPSNGDLIRINAEDSIGSLKGNVIQTVKENLYCELEVLTVSIDPDMKVLSPINPTEFIIPEELKSSKSTIEHGMPMVIDFLVVLPDDIVEKLDARIAIFDQIGNRVAFSNGRDDNSSSKNIEVTAFSSDKTLLVVVWDGTNSKGRIASSGTYLMSISYISSDGVTRIEKSLFVGVKN